MGVARSEPPPFTRVPVLKLPPSWFEPVMDALSKGDGSRSDADRRVLTAMHGRFDAKLAMRALSVPTLTRLHFIRAAPGALRLAPNGSLWTTLKGSDRRTFVGLCLRDLLVHTLDIEPPLATAEGLDRARRRLGRPYFDRLAGYARLMKQYGPPSGGDRLAFLLGSRGSPSGQAFSMEAFKLRVRAALEAELRGKQIVRVDDLRQGAMASLAKRGLVSSSFALDRGLVSYMSRNDLCLPVGAATNRLGALVLNRRPFDAVRSLVSG
jgi:hypothetical protein